MKALKAAHTPNACFSGCVATARLSNSTGHGPYLQHRSRGARSAAVSPQMLAWTSSEFNSNINLCAVPDNEQYPPEVRGAVILTLDNSGNIHSLYRPSGGALTGAYWDALALLPALVPPGPIAILGLAAGTVAHLVHELYPERVMHGWELDPEVLALAQQYMGLQALQDSGCLVAHVGDALADTASVEGGAAGIIVDLFAEGQLIPQLTQAQVWRSIRHRLQPGGRVMCNLGFPPGVAGAHPASVERTQAALVAMAEAFEGDVICSVCGSAASSNMMAMSGTPPTTVQWSQVPQPLQQYACGARFFGWQSHSTFQEGLSNAFFNW